MLRVLIITLFWFKYVFPFICDQHSGLLCGTQFNDKLKEYCCNPIRIKDSYSHSYQFAEEIVDTCCTSKKMRDNEEVRYFCCGQRNLGNGFRRRLCGLSKSKKDYGKSILNKFGIILSIKKNCLVFYCRLFR